MYKECEKMQKKCTLKSVEETFKECNRNGTLMVHSLSTRGVFMCQPFNLNVMCRTNLNKLLIYYCKQYDVFFGDTFACE